MSRGHGANSTPLRTTTLPTRLIDVGRAGSGTVRIVETGPDHDTQSDYYRYVALSHPWGDARAHPPFCTFPDNLERHRCPGIRLGDLPRTFRDAVTVTRALGLAHLWIDSLCIVQGPAGDFHAEAGRMGDVFSSAYCVLAATRATSQHDGFLRERECERSSTTRPKHPDGGVGVDEEEKEEEKECIGVVAFRRRAGEDFYVCRARDDFGRDVLDGGLNRRGWVLQERALARRTIYFAEARLPPRAVNTSTKAAFLGDPNFPQLGMDSSRGSKIELYQDLYRRYSTLAFSRVEDRPVAIAGLEKRLVGACGNRGGYGVFDDGARGGLLHRSLLWHRSPREASLSRIAFFDPSSGDQSQGQDHPDHDHHHRGRSSVVVPSWSWMAYRGAIDYLRPPFNGVEWEPVGSPWSPYPDLDLDPDPDPGSNRGEAAAAAAENKEAPLPLPLPMPPRRVDTASDAALLLPARRTPGGAAVGAVLRATARPFSLAAAAWNNGVGSGSSGRGEQQQQQQQQQQHEECRVVFDVAGQQSDGFRPRDGRFYCVVVGVSKHIGGGGGGGPQGRGARGGGGGERGEGRADADDRRRAYVLIVAPRPGLGDASLFERVGAGFMPMRAIDMDGPGMHIKID
ncbi:heterokaryon incompatibility protein-domain-containing protein [Xylariaceae sp. FL0804]|nr:heterokaryon incompatibility protein-domain-containing protein [Xylariaceae sp. FL0804]